MDAVSDPETDDSFSCLILPADITVPCRLERIPTLAESGLDRMQKLVGGYVEAVRVDWGRLFDPTLPEGVHVSRQATLYVNEEYRFYPDLIFNSRASQLYPWSGGIYGDAFLCGPPDLLNGYDADVPVEAVNFFLP